MSGVSGAGVAAVLDRLLAAIPLPGQVADEPGGGEPAAWSPL